MELTTTYTQNQPVSEAEYKAFCEEKTQIFMEVVLKGLGKNMTTREQRNMEYAFKKGMEIVTQGGKFISREVLQ